MKNWRVHGSSATFISPGCLSQTLLHIKRLLITIHCNVKFAPVASMKCLFRTYVSSHFHSCSCCLVTKAQKNTNFESPVFRWFPITYPERLFYKERKRTVLWWLKFLSHVGVELQSNNVNIRILKLGIQDPSAWCNGAQRRGLSEPWGGLYLQRHFHRLCPTQCQADISAWLVSSLIAAIRASI